MKWGKVKIEEVCTQIRGVTYSPQDISEISTNYHLPILRAGNITDSGLAYNDLVYVDKMKISEKQLLKKGDIIIAASSGSKSVVGKACYFENNWTGSFGAFCKVVRPNKLVNSKFLSYYFQTKEYRHTISQLSEGANINNLRTENLANLLLPLPSIIIQNKIANILDKANQLRSKDKLLLAKYDELQQSVFYEMFGDPISNIKGFKFIRLEEVISEGPQNGLYKHSNDYGEGNPILRIDSFNNGVVSKIDSLKRVKVSNNELKLFEINRDDIVINRVNSLSHLGKAAIIPILKERTVFESNMMKIKVDCKKILPRYLVSMLIHPYVKAQVLNRAKDAVNQSSINQQDIKSFKILLPPISLQIKYVEKIKNIEEGRKILIDSIFQSENLFQTLLQKAFKGELIK